MPSTNSTDNLPTIEKTVTHDQIRRYAQASGDFNPVHLHEDFAAQSSFGRIVAHGMMTLAFLSEMLTDKFGVNWLSSGSLKVRFKRPAYPGDTLQTWGKVTDEQEIPDHILVKCDVALRNAATNEDLITGTATVHLPKPNSTP